MQVWLRFQPQLWVARRVFVYLSVAAMDMAGVAWLGESV
jgi:hypothetical protein|tara:strand:+ start:368 stop:484 length:117 start_codon:yes stop_codon:yes gene_type:complete